VWADEQGREIALPDGPDRAVTLVADDLAAMIHDPVLLDQPELLEAAGSAARLALENERLQAELRLQLAELRTSRERIVHAADEERRRLERDLHDGAQQRLLGVGMALQLIRPRIEGNEHAETLLEEAETEVRGAIAELRELAQGIHPAVLTAEGLDAAVRTLAERTPIPVDVDVDVSTGSLPSPVETVAYFVVAEALTNIAKHAHARRAWVAIAPVDGRLTIDVGDDGVGGAAPNGGSGLQGLMDRIGALDGALRVDSVDGAGTRLHAEIPCGS
jgi:signal transduction histidine kinase